MAGAKLVVLYPYPADVAEFERAYTEEHMPLVSPETVPGITKFTGTKMLVAADGGQPQFYRMAELYFDSLDALQNAVSSEGAQKAVAHAAAISSGGAPVIMVAQEDSIEF